MWKPRLGEIVRTPVVRRKGKRGWKKVRGEEPAGRGGSSKKPKAQQFRRRRRATGKRREFNEKKNLRANWGGNVQESKSFTPKLENLCRAQVSSKRAGTGC